jgi:hypothetical protein
MSTILNTYPVFESNQVLTSPQLNQLVNYLDQQNRLTRAKLIGMGVACGLKISYDASIATLTISKGTGITSKGYLINLGECPIVKYRPYTLPPGVIYEPFVDADTNLQDITLYELLTDNAEDGTEDKVLTKPSGFLTDKVVILFVESFDKDLKSCLGKSCDELGKDRILTIRKLLISQTDLVIVWARTNSGKLDAIYPEKYDLPVINLPRALFDPTASHSSVYEDFNNNYVNAFEGIYNDLFDALIQTYDIYRPILLDSYDEHNPFTRAPITNLKSTWREFFENVNHPGNAYLGMQYMYDFIQDLILAYEEFKMTSFELLSECCPDMTRFPKHLMLGEAIPPPPDLCSTSEFRNEFVQPPIYNEQKELLKRTVALHNRIVLMLESFNLDRINGIGSNTIKITPSKEKSTPLSARSIPWYYDIDQPSSYSNLNTLEEYWNYDISKKCVVDADGLLLSYQKQNDDQSSVGDKLSTPLYYDIQDYTFYRIEGHIGKAYGTAETEIKALRDQFNLPFELLTLRLDGSPNEDFHQLCQLHYLESDYLTHAEELKCMIIHIIDYWTTNQSTYYGDTFATKFLLRTPGFESHFNDLETALQTLHDVMPGNLYGFSQQDFITDFIDHYETAITKANDIKQALNNNLDEVVHSLDEKHPVELYTKLSQIYSEFFRHLDHFIISCNHRKIAIVYHHYLYVIDYLETHDKKLFSRYITEEQGIEHRAGVKSGGTFILLRNGVAVNGLTENDVIGDFMLPYAYCCDHTCLEVPTPALADLNIPNYTLPDQYRFHQGLYAFGEDLWRDVKTRNAMPVLVIDVNSQIHYDKVARTPQEVVLNLIQNGAVATVNPVNSPFDAIPFDISSLSESIRADYGYVAIAYIGDVQNFLYQPDKEHVGFDSFNYVFAFDGDEQELSTMGKVHVYTSCCVDPKDKDTCFNVHILSCWGDPVMDALNRRGIDPYSGDPNELLLEDLQRTCGFRKSELSIISNDELKELANCILFDYASLRIYETLPLKVSLYIYQQYNAGPTTNKDLYKTLILEQWGTSNVEQAITSRGLVVGSNSPFEVLYDELQRTAGFYPQELAKLSATKINSLLSILELTPLTGLAPWYAISEYQRMTSGPALSQPGFGKTIFESWGEPNVTNILDGRGITHGAGADIYDLLNNSIRATRGLNIQEYTDFAAVMPDLLRSVIDDCITGANYTANPLDIIIPYQEQNCCERKLPKASDIIKDINPIMDSISLVVDALNEVKLDEPVDTTDLTLLLIENDIVLELLPINNPGDPLPLNISDNPDAARTAHGHTALVYVGDILNFIYQPDAEHIGFDEFKYSYAFVGSEDEYAPAGKILVYTSCCGLADGSTTDGCYDIKVLTEWGLQSVVNVLGSRGIDPQSGNPYQLLLQDLRETCGFTQNEVNAMTEDERIVLFNAVLYDCVRFRFYQDPRKDIEPQVDLDVEIFIYMNLVKNAGPTNNRNLYKPDLLKCWGEEYVMEAISFRKLHLPAGSNPFEFLYNDLQKTAGFTYFELSKMPSEKIGRLMECWNLELRDDLDEIFSVLEEQRILSGPAVEDIGYTEGIINCWNEGYVNKIFDMRAIEDGGENPAARLLQLLMGTRGFTMKEIYELGKDAYTELTKCIIEPCVKGIKEETDSGKMILFYQQQHCCVPDPITTKDFIREIKSKKDTPTLLIDVISELDLSGAEVNPNKVRLWMVNNGEIVDKGPINAQNDPISTDIAGHQDSIRTASGHAALVYNGDVIHLLYQPDKEHFGFDKLDYTLTTVKQVIPSPSAKVYVYTSCCTDKPPVSGKGCYTLEMLKCMGGYLDKIMGDRSIDPTAEDAHERLHVDLLKTCGFTPQELAKLTEDDHVDIANCITRHKIGLRMFPEWDVANMLYDYQQFNSGPSNDFILYDTKKLSLWGNDNLQKALKSRGIEIGSGDPALLLRDELQRTAGFYLDELMSMLASETKNLLELLGLSASTQLETIFNILEYQRQKSGTAKRNPGFEKEILECWGETNVMKVLEMRALDPQGANIYEFLNSQIVATRGFSFLEYIDLDVKVSSLLQCVIKDLISGYVLSDDPLDIIIPYQEQYCCTPTQTKTCYSEAILACWGMEHVKRSLEKRSIDYSGMTESQIINTLLTSLRDSKGYTLHEIRFEVPLEVEAARRSLLTCLDINHDGATYDELQTLIVDYQKEYCGFVEVVATSTCTSTFVTGKVSTTSGLALPGVSIMVKGTTLGANTDVNGDYSINLVETERTLVFNVPGYNLHEIAICNQSEVDVQLIDQITHFDVDPILIDPSDLIKVLKGRDADVTNLDNPVKIETAFAKSRGGLRIAEDELGILTIPSLKRILKSIGGINEPGDKKGDLIDKIMNI